MVAGARRVLEEAHTAAASQIPDSPPAKRTENRSNGATRAEETAVIPVKQLTDTLDGRWMMARLLSSPLEDSQLVHRVDGGKLEWRALRQPDVSSIG